MPVNEALLHGPVFGNLYVKEATAIVFALLMGALPVRAIVAWLVADMGRASVQSGLDGPFAVLRLFAYATGIAGFVVEVAIGFVPTAIVAHGGGPAFGFYAGLAVVVGHACSPWRRRDRDDEVAVLAGALLAICWPAGLIFIAVGAVTAAASGYASAGGLVAALFSFVPLWYFAGVPGAFYGLAAAALVVWGLRDHVVRLSEGREPVLVLLPFAKRTAARSAPVRVAARTSDGSGAG
jgi:glycerol-3-phosphate acyltransferase PlsY